MASGKKTGGRTKGTPNKLTASIKESIEAAFTEVGGVKYLVAQANNNPNAFLVLLGKVLPKDVTIEANITTHEATIDELG